MNIVDIRYIEEYLKTFKFLIEDAIKRGGVDEKNKVIRSSKPVNLIHDMVKKQLIENDVNNVCIFPHIGSSKPEIKIAGWLKQKDQDICAIPMDLEKIYTKITWGPLGYSNVYDDYGEDFSEKTLIVNVRSQLSSLAKNTDTLFERTFAEALNLHMKYPKAVLGDVYLIPVREYDDDSAKRNIVAFKKKKTKIEQYISFFYSISNRRNTSSDLFKYERCALLVVDFCRETPFLYSTLEELKRDGLVSTKFNVDYSKINFINFSKDILQEYKNRFGTNHIFS